MAILLAGLVALLAVLIWAASVVYITDFSVPALPVPKLGHVLIIFPHADDETNVAGLVWLLRRQGAKVTFVVLTKGEKGTPNAHENSKLKDIRAAEMQAARNRLGGGQLIQEDFGDGELEQKPRKLERYISDLLTQVAPDVIVTYDLAGMYGHPDHITCTEVITNVLKHSGSQTELWYLAFAPRLWRHLNLPIHMAHDPAFYNRRARPTMCLFIGWGVLAKIQAVYSHKSQRQSFRGLMPLHLPIWFVYSLQLFEYYERVR